MWSDEEEEWSPAPPSVSSNLPQDNKRKRSLDAESSDGDNLGAVAKNNLQLHCVNISNNDCNRINISISEKPLALAVWKGAFVVVKSQNVEKVQGDDVTSRSVLYTPPNSHCISQVQMLHHKILMILKPVQKDESSWHLVQYDLCNDTVKVLMRVEEPVAWMQAFLAGNLKPSLYQDNKVDMELEQGATICILSCLTKHYLITEIKTFPLVVTKNIRSRVAFFLQHATITKRQEEEGIASFSDVLGVTASERKVENCFSDADIITAQIIEDKLVVQHANGTVWLYAKSERRCLAQQIYTFSWLHKTLTLVTNDLRVYTFDAEETLSAKMKNNAQNARSSAEQFCRTVKSVEEKSSEEKLKLDHIRLFTRLHDGFQLFQVSINLQQNVVSLQKKPTLVVQLRLLEPNLSITDGFFILKLVVLRRCGAEEMSIPVRSLARNDRIIENIQIEDLTLEDFPLILQGYLCLIGERFQKGNKKFLISEKILEKEICPLLFLEHKLDNIRTREIKEEINRTKDESDRGKFLQLLCNNNHLSTRKTSKIRIQIGKNEEDENDCSSLKKILLSEGIGSALFTFLEKDLYFTLEDDQPKNSSFRSWKLCGQESVIALLSQYFKTI
eukprot:TRINITY_DN5305_c0_g1_i2.p1 TRINITY_DN5305_c0_g1~~TRINITY_DN5305_c0_g1_i2.p1  ORF type:complete len:615 (-),score=96.91 TRINITY_DN5305_c0_g1_i2:192-2036(-)